MSTHPILTYSRCAVSHQTLPPCWFEYPEERRLVSTPVPMPLYTRTFLFPPFSSHNVFSQAGFDTVRDVPSQAIPTSFWGLSTQPKVSLYFSVLGVQE